MRAAFASIAANTGCSSPREELMTRSTSDVAVCCSKDSESSRVRCCSASNSRVFSIVVSKGSNQIDLLLSERLDLISRHEQHADWRVLSHEGDAECRTEAANGRRFL